MDDALYSLVYTSSAVREFTDEQLHDLLERSREHNRRRDITGILIHRNGRFIQFLEGPESAVRELMARIASDDRHDNVRVLIDEHPTTRHFGEWTMGYQPAADADEPLPEGFRSTFDDLDDVIDEDYVLRATRELSVWFRARSR